jgi:hypothetical protein
MSMPKRSTEYKDKVKIRGGEFAVCTATFSADKPEDVISAMKFMRSVTSNLVSGLVGIRAVMGVDKDDNSITVEAVGFLRGENVLGFLRGRNEVREVLVRKTIIAIAQGVSSKYFGKDLRI